MISLGESIRGWTALLRRLTSARGQITPMLSETVTPTLEVGPELLHIYTELPEFSIWGQSWAIGGGTNQQTWIQLRQQPNFLLRLKRLAIWQCDGSAVDQHLSLIDARIIGSTPVSGSAPGVIFGPVSNDADSGRPGLLTTGNSGTLDTLHAQLWRGARSGEVVIDDYDLIMFPLQALRIQIFNNSAVLINYAWELRYQLIPRPDQ